MKTTLIINDQIMHQLKQRAVKEKRTISSLVETALRLLLGKAAKGPALLPKLPTFHGGKERVDVANRSALYEFMEKE